ncbi:hypothetical protein L7F22_009628 [Adiantum nelumboides]|nr:hypothetical protein [Adiantum nelumboides]
MGGGAEAFDPIDLDIDLTPDNVRFAMNNGQSVTAIIGALRLGDQTLLAEVYEHVKPQDIPLVVQQLPLIHLPAILRLVTRRMAPSTSTQKAIQEKEKENSTNGDVVSARMTTTSSGGSPHVEFHLLWLASILGIHGSTLRKSANSGNFAPILRSAAAALQEISANVNRMAEDNLHLMLYLWGAMRESGQEIEVA